jgi:hypothetical protein
METGMKMAVLWVVAPFVGQYLHKLHGATSQKAAIFMPEFWFLFSRHFSEADTRMTVICPLACTLNSI